MHKFSLKCQQELIELESNSGDGSVAEYAIREMNGRDMTEYLNSTRTKVLMTDGKVTGMKTFDGMYSNLLARSMWNADGERVLQPDIDLWPSSTQKGLFDIAQKINKLGVNDEDDEGNE